jgi:hypothetical protein
VVLFYPPGLFTFASGAVLRIKYCISHFTLSMVDHRSTARRAIIRYGIKNAGIFYAAQEPGHKPGSYIYILFHFNTRQIQLILFPVYIRHPLRRIYFNNTHIGQPVI